MQCINAGGRSTIEVIKLQNFAEQWLDDELKMIARGGPELHKEGQGGVA